MVARAASRITQSQMPFGFWVLGNTRIDNCKRCQLRVSNAFRLLGSGEREAVTEAEIDMVSVSNAFRLLGSGEPGGWWQKTSPIGAVSNAFRLLGSGERQPSAWRASPRRSGLKCLSAFGFWGTPSL